MYIYVTHVRSCPLLPCELLLLGVGGGHLQVEHWLQPGGASIDPFTPLIILINAKQQKEVILCQLLLKSTTNHHFFWTKLMWMLSNQMNVNIFKISILKQTYQKEDLDQTAVHLLHFALPPGSLPLCFDDLADL